MFCDDDEEKGMLTRKTGKENVLNRHKEDNVVVGMQTNEANRNFWRDVHRSAALTKADCLNKR